MDIKKGDRVTLMCAGNTCTGKVTLCCPNQGPLAIQIDEPFRTSTGTFHQFVPLSLRDDGRYHELVDNQVIDLAVTQ